MSPAKIALWAICFLATAGVIIRPFRLPEAIWAVAGAALLLLLGLIPPTDALSAVAKGSDVYLFLIGMMLLSEAARREGLFDWLAQHAVRHARGSASRLFLLVFAVGTVVTGFLSNDATAVVLTPAVYAAARKARTDPLPLLFACAMIANAASFVLPISNPANLVLYGGHMPPLGAWLRSFALPSLLSIVATFAMLRFVERDRLRGTVVSAITASPLTRGGAIALAGIVGTALLLLAVSALDRPLGAWTCAAGAFTAGATLIVARQSPGALVRSVSWSILPLVAGLFVLVEALDRSGVVALLADRLAEAARLAPDRAAAGSAVLLAIATNLTNNLPAGLVAAGTIAHAAPPQQVTDALLIAVDLGPNLSITGSLATILWLSAIRREGEDVGFWRFLKVGAAVMPPALILALAARLL